MKNGLESIYMFELRTDVIIDATFMGSFARFINHSCNANVESCSMFSSNGVLVPNNMKTKGEALGIGMYGNLAMG